MKGSGYTIPVLSQLPTLTTHNCHTDKSHSGPGAWRLIKIYCPQGVCLCLWCGAAQVSTGPGGQDGPAMLASSFRLVDIVNNNGTHFFSCPNRAGGDNAAAFQPVSAVLDEYSFTHAHPLIGMAALQDSSLWDEVDTTTSVTPVEIPGEKPNGVPQQSWGSSSLSDAVRVRHNAHWMLTPPSRPHDPSI